MHVCYYIYYSRFIRVVHDRKRAAYCNLARNVVPYKLYTYEDFDRLLIEGVCIMRRISKQVIAGGVKIGGGAPISVQSMLNVPAHDIEGSVQQAVALERAGCQIIRAAIPDMDAVRLIPALKYIHSSPYLPAMEAAAAAYASPAAGPLRARAACPKAPVYPQ